MIAKLFLLAAFVVTGNHWHTVKGGAYTVNKLYLNHYGNVIGDYYQWPKAKYAAHETPRPFIAQCSEFSDINIDRALAHTTPTEFATESEAKSFVENCPQ